MPIEFIATPRTSKQPGAEVRHEAVVARRLSHSFGSWTRMICEQWMAEFAMPFIASNLALFLTSEFENVQWETSHMSQAMFGVSQYIFPAPGEI